MNYFNFYSGDYRRDSADLSLTEHGAFFMLIQSYYSTELPLPSDPVRLYAICGAKSEQDMLAVDYVSQRFFKPDGDVLRNGRADAEIKKAQKQIKTARLNGAKRKVAGNPAGNPGAYDQQSQRVTHTGVGVGVGVGAPNKSKSTTAESSSGVPCGVAA